MTKPPASPKIYHITPVDNLVSIIKDGRLLADAVMIKRGGPATAIGMSRIKQRRLQLPVDCHPGTFVGEYVPFYYCPRSVMLFMIHRKNRELTYRGGQEPIVHLEADLHKVVEWAESHDGRWAFTRLNAATNYAKFYKDKSEFSLIDWTAVQARDFRDPDVQEHKQAEFLLYGSFPWNLVERIGVYSAEIMIRVRGVLEGVSNEPAVVIRKNWYY